MPPQQPMTPQQLTPLANKAFQRQRNKSPSESTEPQFDDFTTPTADHVSSHSKSRTRQLRVHIGYRSTIEADGETEVDLRSRQQPPAKPLGDSMPAQRGTSISLRCSANCVDQWRGSFSCQSRGSGLVCDLMPLLIECHQRTLC